MAANDYARFQYDNALLLKALAAVTSSADGTLILEVGAGLIDALLIAIVTAIDTASADEAYTIILEGSPDATFGTAANIVALGRLALGAATPIAPQGAATAAGVYTTAVRNEQNGTIYPYLRIRTVVAGTTPTITYTAFLAPRA